jgi:hypothetical protein
MTGRPYAITRWIKNAVALVTASVIAWGLVVVLATVVGFAAHAVVTGFQAGWDYWQ